MELSVTTREDGIMVLGLSGRMDIDGTGEVDLKLNAVTAEDHGSVIGDLTGITFMSSIGIGALVRVAKAVRRRGGNMVLCGAQPVVKLALEKTGIPSLIPMFDTMAEAVSGIAEQPRVR